MIRVVCPGCEKGIKVPPEMAEAPFACPGCGTAVDPQQHRQVESKPEPAMPTEPEAPPIVISTAAAAKIESEIAKTETQPQASSTNLFQSPSATADQSTVNNLTAAHPITIVGVSVPFLDIFRILLKLSAAMLLISFGFWIIAGLLALTLDAVGVSFPS